MKLLDQKEINALVVKAQSGDRDAFGELYSLYYQKVYYAAVKVLKNNTAAEDIVQAVFVQALENIQHLAYPKHFSTWLYRVTYNACLNYLSRSSSNTVELSQIYNLKDTSADSHPDHRLMDKLRQDILLDALNSLSENHRIVVIMKYYSNLKIKEIAEILSISEGTVKSRLSYSRKYLRKALGKHREMGLLAGFPLAEALQANAGALGLPAENAQSILRRIVGEQAHLSQITPKATHTHFLHIVSITGLSLALTASLVYCLAVTFITPDPVAQPLPSATAAAPVTTAAPTAIPVPPSVSGSEVIGDTIVLTLSPGSAPIDPATFKIEGPSGAVPISFDPGTNTLTLPFSEATYTLTFGDIEGNWQRVAVSGSAESE